MTSVKAGWMMIGLVVLNVMAVIASIVFWSVVPLAFVIGSVVTAVGIGMAVRWIVMEMRPADLVQRGGGIFDRRDRNR